MRAYNLHKLGYLVYHYAIRVCCGDRVTWDALGRAVWDDATQESGVLSRLASVPTGREVCPSRDLPETSQAYVTKL